MIDTEKYITHAPAPWKWNAEGELIGDNVPLVILDKDLSSLMYMDMQTADLIADAPLLLAEVLRLREQVKKWEDDWIRMANYISHHDKEMYEAIDEDIGWED
jgi:hypothetical protein